MAKLLYIEASPRKERSHSIAVANAFLDAYAAAHPDDTIDRLDLWTETLPAFDGAMLDAKYAILHGEQPGTAEQAAWGEVERVVARFTSADKYLISMPMWNFGLPYVMKHYIDIVDAAGADVQLLARQRLRRARRRSGGRGLRQRRRLPRGQWRGSLRPAETRA